MSKGKETAFFRDNPLFRVLFREIDRMTGSSIYVFTTLIGPLISFVILLAVFSEGVPRDLPVGLVDKDRTVLSQKIGMWIHATPEANIVLHLPNTDEAYKQMEEGKIEAVIVIPEGTEKNILKGSQQKIPVFINNTNILKGGYLQKGIYKAMATLSGGIKLQVAQKKGQSVNQAMATAQPVRLHQHILFNPYGNYSYFLLTALLPLMVVVFTLLTTVYAVGTEVREGTGPDWLNQASGSVIVAVTGKLIPYTLLFSIVSVVMNVVLFIQMGAPLRGEFLLIVTGELALILTYQMLGMFLVALTTNLRLSLSLGSAYSMMALTFSGLTFPAIAMPAVAEGFSYAFPFTYWVHIFISQAIRGEAPVYGMKYLSMFLVFILISVLALPRLRRVLQKERYWGKI